MSEHEWFTSANIEAMVRSVEHKTSDRKLLLFAVACCRSVWDRVKRSRRSRHAVEVAERYTEGLATDAELGRAYRIGESAERGRGPAAAAATQSANAAHVFYPRIRSAVSAQAAAINAANYASAARADDATSVRDEAWEAARLAAYTTQAAILRDVIGDPFAPAVVDSAWLSWEGGVVPRLAQAIYDQGSFQDLPMLADALEDAGCTDAAILAHCRGPGPHTRGCWLLDALLGKE